jgi:hypothetical protein
MGPEDIENLLKDPNRHKELNKILNDIKNTDKIIEANGLTKYIGKGDELLDEFAKLVALLNKNKEADREKENKITIFLKDTNSCFQTLNK